MSYCGACGSFFYPDCPRRPLGLCIPSLNPYEQKIVEALAQVAAANLVAASAVAECQGYTGNAIELTEMAQKMSRLFDEPGSP